MRAARFVVTLVLALVVAGCGGWHLRGTGPGAAVPHTVYIRHRNSDVVARAVRQQLINRGGRVTRRVEQADVVLDLDGERYERRILSVDPDTGKVREIELGLGAAFAMRSRDGRLLVPREEMTWELDYIFDEGSVLGTVEQDSLVQRDLAEMAATTIVLRIQAVEVPEPLPAAPAAAATPAPATAAAP